MGETRFSKAMALAVAVLFVGMTMVSVTGNQTVEETPVLLEKIDLDVQAVAAELASRELDQSKLKKVETQETIALSPKGDCK